MDVASHGLWGGVAFGRKNKKSFWTAFVFGVAPDLLAFGPFFVASFLGFGSRRITPGEPPDPSLIPSYIPQIYQITHSLVVFVAVFGIVWLITRRPVWEMLSWPLHILMDIPTHTSQFFPTPFLWPLSDFKVSGISWGHPYIFFPNVAALIILYIWFFVTKKRYANHDA